jgi:hypothetical protein
MKLKCITKSSIKDFLKRRKQIAILLRNGGWNWGCLTLVDSIKPRMGLLYNVVLL